MLSPNRNVVPTALHADLRHVIYALSDALDLVGIDDAAHGKRVGIMAAECALRMGLGESETTFLFDLGLLHDIGVSSTRIHQHLIGEFDWAGSQDHASSATRCWPASRPLQQWPSRFVTTIHAGTNCSPAVLPPR